MITSTMEQEACETPALIAKQLAANEATIMAVRERLQNNPPPFAITIGRGSSDHACTYGKYLLETQLGLVTASAAPSVATVYNARLKMQGALVIGVSQSGRSPDICKMMDAARNAGAITVAIVNDTESLLAVVAEYVLPLHAGKENAVAATKSYITSLTALAQLTAILAHNDILYAALKQLPEKLQQTLQLKDFAKMLEEFQNIDRTLVIARGFGFPIAQEAALKFKETAAIQAEAFSAAEVLHGPFALIKRNHPFLLFTQNDATLLGTISLAKKIKSLGGKSILVLPEGLLSKAELAAAAYLAIQLPKSLDPILDPIVAIQAFYPMIAKLAISRGYNPDAPENLQKVTETF